MFIKSRLYLSLLVLSLCSSQVSARQNNSASQPRDGKIHLDVVVAAKSGSPVSDLRQQDFEVLDDKTLRTITSFRAVDGQEESIEVLVVVDTVNTDLQNVAYERAQIEKFFRRDGGHLAYPTALAVFTDAGTQLQEGFTDGNELSDSLEKITIGRRYLGGSSGPAGASERFDLSLNALREIALREGSRPGRKFILWVSPGWPLLSGPRVEITNRQQQQIFDQIVNLSTLLLDGRITLYSIDPLGMADAAGLRTTYWKDFLKGISKPSEALPGNLALEVLATQSGGLALSSSNDVANLLHQCLADAAAYYELAFDVPITDQTEAYHHLEVRVTKPGVIGRTRQGYYSQSRPAQSLVVEPKKTGMPDDGTPPQNSPAGGVAPKDANDPSLYASAHPYMNLPLAHLIELVPELKSLRPAPDQQELPMILAKVGERVDDFIYDIGDLVAHEDVIQEQLNAKGKVVAKEVVQDEYLILHHGNNLGASAEYRMDKEGNRLDSVGLETGYLITSGFALNCISFATEAQVQSKFQYLGEEKIGSRETYVLGFAQQPGQATFRTTMKGPRGTETNILTQGILWVDKTSFQIIRMRTDLLEPNKEIRLDRATTEVTFSEVHLPDMPNPLWVPSDVNAYMEIDDRKFRNVHHYANYRRYRVSVKIGTPQ